MIADGLRHFNLSEILDRKRLGKTEWGFVFYQDDEFRQSIDFDSYFVVIEKMFEGQWRCASSYIVNSRAKNKTEEFINEAN